MSLLSYNPYLISSIPRPRRSFNQYYDQIGRGHYQTGGVQGIKATCYVMLSAGHYQKDTANLIRYVFNNFQNSNLIRQLYQSNWNLPSGNQADKHITILQFDLFLTSPDIRALSKNTYSLTTIKNDQTQNPQNGKPNPNNKWIAFKTNIEGRLQLHLNAGLTALFANTPTDTTASIYPSRFKILPSPPVPGKRGFLTVAFRSDLAFIKNIIPNIQNTITKYFSDRGGQVQMGIHYQNPANIILHMSIGKEKNQNPPVPPAQQIQKINKIQAELDQVGSKISYNVARNYVISPSHLNQNVLSVSLGGGIPNFY